MTCAFGCSKPAIGLAELEGISAPVVSIVSALHLCEYHFQTLDPTHPAPPPWTNVVLRAWHPFASEAKSEAQATDKSSTELQSEHQTCKSNDAANTPA